MKIKQEFELKYQIGDNLKVISKWDSTVKKFVIKQEFVGHTIEEDKKHQKPHLIQDVIIGLDYDTACSVIKEHGYHTCLVKEDDTNFMMHYNLDFFRVNLWVENKIVVKANVG